MNIATYTKFIEKFYDTLLQFWNDATKDDPEIASEITFDEFCHETWLEWTDPDPS